MNRYFLSYTHKARGPESSRGYGNIVEDTREPLNELDIRQIERLIEEQRSLPPQSVTLLFYQHIRL